MFEPVAEPLKSYLELCEHPLEEALTGLLRAFSSQAGGDVHLVLSFPAPGKGWRAVSSDGQVYDSLEPWPEQFALPPHAGEVVSQRISLPHLRETGRLTVVAASPSESMRGALPVWAHLASLLIRRDQLERVHQLHEKLAQSLYGVVLGALSIRAVLDRPEKAQEAVDYVLKLAEWGLEEIRAAKG